MKEIRPRRQTAWKFGLAILILMGIILFKYNLKLDYKVSSTFVSLPPPTIFTPASNPSSSSTNQSNHAPTSSNPRQTELAEVHNIVFVKVHKAASSVVQNILLRFALRRKLNVMFPIRGHLINESGSHVDEKSIMPLPKGQGYNILCNHVIFNKRETLRFFPNSTKYIGILRHPLSQMSSALYYYGMRYKKSSYIQAFRASPRNPLSTFLSRPFLYDLDAPRKSFVNNRMSIDFGFPVTKSFEDDKKDTRKISNFIRDIEKSVDLILVVELFEESLILLRRLFHWETRDVLYMKLNVNNQQHKQDQSQFTLQDKTIHREWAAIDYALYGHFKKRIEATIAEGGDDFKQELASFRRIEKTALKFCRSVKSGKESSKLYVEKTKWSKGFHITKELCRLMNEGETSMIALVRKRQKQRLGV